MKHLFTIGYEGVTIEHFVERLQGVDIEFVLDVRATPLSRIPLGR